MQAVTEPWLKCVTPVDSDALVPRPVIYYVRHGLTDWNVQQRLQGRHDVPLNTEGCAQAVRCGEILRDLFARDGGVPEDLDYVSSPLIRARKTMELVRTTLGLDAAGYGVDARLAEIAFGEWEGLTYADVLARDKDIVARRESDKWGFPAARRRKLCAGHRPNGRMARRRSTETPWLPPMAAPRAPSSRISRSHRRRTPRIIPSIRAWSMCSRATS